MHFMLRRITHKASSYTLSRQFLFPSNSNQARNSVRYPFISRELSTASQPGTSDNASKPSQSPLPKLILGGVAVASILGVLAYQRGYIQLPDHKQGQLVGLPAGAVVTHSNEQSASILKPENSEHEKSSSIKLHDGQMKNMNQAEASQEVAPSGSETTLEGESQQDKEKSSDLFRDSVIIEDNRELSPSSDSVDAGDKGTISEATGGTPDMITIKNEISQDTSISLDEGNAVKQTLHFDNDSISQDKIYEPKEENVASQQPPVHDILPSSSDVITEEPKEAKGETLHTSQRPSLSSAYSLHAEEKKSSDHSLDKEDVKGHISEFRLQEAPAGVGSTDQDRHKDEKLVIDFIEAIHAAEKKQADMDTKIFTEEKQLLKEKYEKELKDARARELMYAEEAAQLDKELHKEKSRHVSLVKSLEEKAEENLRQELQRKEEEAEIMLKRAKEVSNALVASAIANEKSLQLEKLASANLQINSLCMAFYARSEEARQSHSVHKLVLGTLALEDALSRGMPVEKEIAALESSVEGIDRDSFFKIVIASLPKETLKNGTSTQLQLRQKFETMKSTLRHLSLVPADGGGLLAHSLAHIASLLKMRETGEAGEGIEYVISCVERRLSEGKLAEAADILQRGVSGSQAEEIAAEWATVVRNRAITEQALSLLQSYATALSYT